MGSGDYNKTAGSPPDNSSDSPPPPDSSPPPPSKSTPPPPSKSSPPPPSKSSPPPPETSNSSPPPPEASSPPPPSTKPTDSPPSDNSKSPSPPTTNSSTPTPPTPSTPSSPRNPVISPPPPGAVASRAPPSPVLSPSSPHSSTKTPSVSSKPSPSPSSSDRSNAVIVVVIMGGLILAVIIISIICLRRKKKKQHYMKCGLPPPKGGGGYQVNGRNGALHMNHKPTPSRGVIVPPRGGWGAPPPPPARVARTNSEFGSTPSPRPMPCSVGKSQFTYEELAAATDGFSQANVLGQGGFGFVHKGVLPNGIEVAVKSLKAGSGQGEREFQAEVEIISRVHHRHLVSLVGYCISGQQRMLVYEFVPNKTLEFHLHGKGNPVMDWAARLRIAVGSAKGLAYLHEDCHPRIIHRDIKSANILLDFNFEALVADFGLAKLSPDKFTHVTTRVMGTFGYLAPEYAASGKLTEKSDVFSFGVMLLELITGRRAVDPKHRVMDDSLVDWARPLLSKALEEGDYKELVDPRLEDNYVPSEMARLISAAAASVRHSARRRPRMSQIVRALEGVTSLEDLNDGMKPGQSVPASPLSTTVNKEVYDTRAYNADIARFRKMVLETGHEYSSEFGETSEYGLDPSSSSSDSRETSTKTPDRKKD